MESPEVLNEVGDFCKSLVSQNKYIACQRHMLDCLIPVLVQVSLRIKPKTLQPKHSQYKRTPCLISSTFRWTCPLQKCSLTSAQTRTQEHLSWTEGFLRLAGCPFTEYVLSRKVFIKLQRGNHHIHFDWNPMPISRHETDHPRTSGQQ